jgi:indole-3-glycerol phosphate synthase
MSYLDAILEERRRDILAEKRLVPLETLQAMVAERTDHRDFAASLRRERPAIVAEFKRASPSAGIIRADCDPRAIAMDFERGGAAALSVLTEPKQFRGSFADLCAARAAVVLPVLCKDFVVDDFQIWKAAAFGADALLLIVAALDDAQLRSFVRLLGDLGLAALVEIHDEGEALRAVAAGAHIVGINNRDLATFSVDTTTAVRVRKSLPSGLLVVAESGYGSAQQIGEGLAAQLDAFLVGEHLMRSGDRAAALRALRDVHAWSG